MITPGTAVNTFLMLTECAGNFVFTFILTHSAMVNKKEPLFS